MIKQLIDNITNTQGTNAKIALLESYQHNEVLKSVFWNCLSSTNFYVKQIPEISSYAGDITLEYALETIKKLSSREITGNKARDLLKILLEGLTEDDSLVLTKVIRKKLNCGIEVKGANKVWGSSFIKDSPYMRCTLDPSKIKYPAYSEEKMDGQYLNNFIVNDLYSSESRSGEIYDFFGELDADFINLNNTYKKLYGEPNNVFHGECLVLDAQGNILDRQTSNGIAQKFGVNKGTGTLEEAKRVIVKLWDSVPFDSFNKRVYDIPRKIRRQRLIDALKASNCTRISFVDYRIVNSLEEAIAHSKELIKAKKEGSVLKDENGPWKAHTSPYQCKFKNRVPVELKCVGFVEGKPGTKFEGTLGALIGSSSDGLIEVDVGSGLKEIYDGNIKENVRDYIWTHQDEFLDKIFTAETNSIVKDKNKTIASLFIPSFIEWRNDKNEADSYSRIEAQIKAAGVVGEVE